MSTNPSTFAPSRSRFVDEKGMLTWTALQKLLEYDRKLQNTLNLLGEIASAAKIQGSTETIDNRVWQTQAMRDAAVDVNGNLLLKNKEKSTATTSSPSAPTGAFATIPEMTKTITTKGNDVLLIFSCNLHRTTKSGGAEDLINIQFKRDSTIIGIIIVEGFANAEANDIDRHISFSHLDVAPAAGSHTYVAEWKATVSSVIKSLGVIRELEVVELG